MNLGVSNGSNGPKKSSSTPQQTGLLNLFSFHLKESIKDLYYPSRSFFLTPENNGRPGLGWNFPRHEISSREKYVTEPLGILIAGIEMAEGIGSQKFLNLQKEFVS